MNIYRVTVNYRATNGFQRSANIIVEAIDENSSRLEAMRLAHHLKYPHITKVAYVGRQEDLDLEHNDASLTPNGSKKK